MHRPIEIDHDTAEALSEFIENNRNESEERDALDLIAADLRLQLAHYCRGGKLYAATCPHCEDRAKHENMMDRLRGGIRP
jgi:hypothetical protein